MSRHILTRWLTPVCSLSLLLLPVAHLAAQGGVSLGLTRYGAGQKIALLVVPIRGVSGDSLGTMLARDFDFSDRFTLVPSSSVAEPNGPLNYDLFAKLAVDGIVQGTLLPSGWLRIVLHDVGKRAIQNQKDFPLPTPAGSPVWRMAVHGISDGIEEWIVGQRGISQTRLSFSRDNRIWTVDSDGANPHAVTPAGMSSAWTPNGRSLVYTVVGKDRNPLFVTEIASGAQRALTSSNGDLDITPAVSPDGRNVVFARVSDAGTDLHLVPIEGGAARRITVGNGRISSGPSFSPDGQRLVFSSDRSGHNEVYICDVDGTNQELLTTGAYGDRNYRVAPDWSPDGQVVAFGSLNGNAGQITTVRLKDQSMKMVTSDGRNEDPSWAPDARHLVFTSNRSGVRQLWVVDVETGRTRQLTRGAAARLSSWSPRLSP